MFYLIGSVLLLFVVVLIKQSQHCKRIFYSGISFWGRFLPVLGIAWIAIVLAMNLWKFSAHESPFFRLPPSLTTASLAVLLALTPVLFFKIGPLLAGFMAAYFSYWQFQDGVSLTDAPGAATILAALILLALLGDKCPWGRALRILPQTRKITLMLLCVSSTILTVMAILQLHRFHQWIGHLGIPLSPTLVLALLMIIALLWILVGMGVARCFILPFVTLPTLLAMEFLTQQSSLLVLPVSISLALFIAGGDRRQTHRAVF